MTNINMLSSSLQGGDNDDRIVLTPDNEEFQEIIDDAAAYIAQEIDEENLELEAIGKPDRYGNYDEVRKLPLERLVLTSRKMKKPD